MPLAFARLTVQDLLEALLAESGFILLLAAGSLILPGRMQAGAPDSDGRRALYKLNGLLLFALIVGGALIGQWTGRIRRGGVARLGPGGCRAAQFLWFA